MKLKKFADAEISKSYVTYNHVNHTIRYKLFNNYVNIDLRDIVNSVLIDAGITGLNADKVDLVMPYDIEDTMINNILSIVVGKKRYNLRLIEGQIALNKQQKIDYDNTHPHRWTLSQWGKYIESKFWSYYGFQNVELNLRGTHGQVRRGKVFSHIRSMIMKILHLPDHHFDEKHVVEYVNWAFAKKSAKLSITLGLLAADSFIQEWLVWRNKKLKERTDKMNLSSKWEDE